MPDEALRVLVQRAVAGVRVKDQLCVGMFCCRMYELMV